MKYRTLGSTGITLSEIGFGTWGIGGNHEGAVAYGATDDKQSEEALELAFDKGINFYDTSDLYGNGHAERLLNRFIARRRSDCIISTKAGFTGHGLEQNFSSSYLLNALDKSLDRMGTDYVDIFMLHSPNLDKLKNLEDLAATFEKLKKTGRIRAWGISARSPRDAMAVLGQYPISCFQVNFSLVDLRARYCGLLDKAREMNVGLIARTPLAFGFLTGNVNPTALFSDDDHRKRFSEEKKLEWSNTMKRYQNCFGDMEATNAQKSLLFCLAFQPITSTIPGMLTVGHVQENLIASQLPRLESKIIRNICKQYQHFNGSN